MAITLYHPEWGVQRPIRGVLFDMDGLVLDSEKLYSRFWREACAAYGYDMSYGQSLKMRALNSRLGEAMLKSFFGPDTDYVTIRTKRIELMDAFIEENGVELKPGILELMAHLEEKKIPAAIASSSPLPRIRSHLSRHGLDVRFAALCSGYEVEKGKPEPDIYRYAAKCLGLRPEECMALEDAPSGITSAYRAGCLTVMVPDQDQPTEDAKAMLYAKADSLADVIGLLK